MDARRTDTACCLDEARLEALAGDRPVEDADRAHASSCAHCRARLEEVRNNNAFLSEMRKSWDGWSDASDGGLHDDDVITGYTVLEEIHRGGQGIVYRGIQREANRTVAIKMLASGAFATASQRHRFKREIETTASLDHPNIVTVYETGSLPDGRCGYVMQYIEGVPLDEWASSLTDDPGLPPDERLGRTLRLILRVCDAVQHAHRKGFIHRDLKPDNILVDEAGEPYILDFGIARGVDAPHATRQTHTGEFIGTIAYASPEQLTRGADVIDTRSDVYAIGVLMYQLLAGTHPHASCDSVDGLVRSIRESEPRRPDEVDPSVPADLATIALKAMSKEPDRRYQSPEAIAEDIDRFLSDEPVTARRNSTWYVMRKSVKRHRVPFALSALLLIALVAFSIGMSLLYGQAVARHRQAQAATSQRNLASGRNAILAGASSLAETLFWREYFASSGPVGLDGVTPQGDGRAFWALTELYAKHPCLFTVHAHEGGAYAVSFVDGGEALATAGENGAVRLWDARSGRSVGLVREEPCAVNSLAHADRGSLLAWGTADGRVVVWDLIEDSLVSEQRTGIRDPTPVFSPDGTHLAYAEAGEVIILHPRTGETRRLEIGEGACHDIRFSPDGDRLATLDTRAIRVFDLATSRARATIDVTGRGVQVIAWSGDGSSLAFGVTHSVRLLTLGKDVEPAIVGRHEANVRSLRRVPGSTSFVSAGQDDTIRYWNTEEDHLNRAYRGHERTITDIAVDPLGRRMASSSADGSVRVWAMPGAEPIRALPGPEDTTHGIAINPMTGVVVSTGGERASGDTRVWRAPDRSYTPPDAALLSSVDIAPDGLTIVLGGYDNNVYLLDAETGDARMPPLANHTDNVNEVRVSPDGRLIASASDDGTTRLWDLNTGEEVGLLRTRAGRVSSCDFNARGDLIATVSPSSPSSAVDIRRVADGRRAERLTGHNAGVRVVRFAPEGDLLATGGDDQSVMLWDARSGRRIRVMEGHRGNVYALAFSSDGTRLASAGTDGRVIVWRTSDGSELLSYKPPLRLIFALAFGPEDGTIVSGGSEGPGKSTLSLLDLDQCERCIAGNLAYRASVHLKENTRIPGLERMRLWADEVLDQFSGVGGNRVALE